MTAPPPIDAELVGRLVAAQFPHWADLPVRPVELDGWDHRTFHLGDRMSVRLPSAEGYVPQGEKEWRWLPRLAPHLPLPIPAPLAQGEPGEGYPFPWSVYGWIDGEVASAAPIDDLEGFALDLGMFLVALRGADATGGPASGPHSAFRGAPLRHYDAETRRAIETLGDEIDAATATEIWETALRCPWQQEPVWFHGDVAVGNLLVRDGRLSAVIDFGCAGVGDPACDTVIAWTQFSGAGRDAFRAALAVDPDTWARGRAWALWKALIVLTGESGPVKATDARRVLDEVLREYRA